MKLINKLFAFAVIVACMASCGLDNYDPPQYTVSGTVVNTTDGKAIQVQGSREKTQIRVFEYGWNRVGSFSLYISQDGTFQGLFFPGEYHLIAAANRGPWATVTNGLNGTINDTMTLVVNGNVSGVEYKVRAYALLDNGSFTLSGNALTGTANITVYDASRAVQYARMFVSETSYADLETNLQASAQFVPSGNAVSANLTLSDETLKRGRRQGLFARIGIKINGVEDLAYTPIFQIMQPE